MVAGKNLCFVHSAPFRKIMIFCKEILENKCIYLYYAVDSTLILVICSMYELFKPPIFVGIEYQNNIIKIFISSKLINIASGVGDEADEGEYVCKCVSGRQKTSAEFICNMYS